MKHNRLALSLTAAGCLALSACAQTTTPSSSNYPSKSIHLVVPFPAGSATDVGTRVIGDCAEKELDQSLVIENIDGGDGLLAMSEVARADNDGYTMVASSTSTLVVAPHFIQDAGYKSDSFDVVGAYSVTPMAFAVAKDSPFTSMDEVLNSSKPLTVVTPGAKSSGGLAVTALDQANPAKFNQAPMGGDADTIRGLKTGDYDVALFPMSPVVLENLGKEVRALALTSEFAPLPDVPTLESLGHGEEVPIPMIIGSWSVPAGTPDAAREALADALDKCTAGNADIRKKLGATIPETFVDGAAVEAANAEAQTKIDALAQ